MNQSLDRPRLPLSSFAVAIVITGTIFAGFIWQGTRSFEQFRMLNRASIEAGSLIADIRHFDEVLATATGMAVETGDIQWKERYATYNARLSANFKRARDLATTPEIRGHARDAEEAHAQVRLIEGDAFDLVDGDQRELAREVLANPTYMSNRQIYNFGLEQLRRDLTTQAIASIAMEEADFGRKKWLFAVGIVLALAAWLHIFRTQVRFARENEALQGDLESRIEARTRELRGEIDQRRQAEAGVRQSRQLLRGLADNLPVFVSFKDLEGRFQFVNKVFEDWVGIGRDEVIGKTVHDVYEAGQAERFAEQDRRVAENREIISREARVSYPDGVVRDVIGTRFPVFSGSGEMFGIGTVNFDVTDRKRIEQEALEQNRLLQLTLESMGQGLTMYDGEWNLVMSNARYREHFDLPGDVFEGDVSFDDVVGATMRLDYDDEWRERLAVVRDPKRMTDVWRRSFERPSGRGLDLLSLPIEGGGFVVTSTDISERLRVEAELREARDRAETLAKTRADFVAVVSHEVRTPMNGVLGMAQLMREMSLSAEAAECLDVITSSGLSLVRIVDDLLDIAKFDADRLELERIPFRLGDVMDEAMRLMEGRFRVKGLAFSCEVAGDLPEILVGDPYRLRQILLNLISNACKFTDRGSVAIEVGSRVEAGDEAVLEFAVSDTGKGIGDEAREKLFSPYTQVKRRRRAKIRRHRPGSGDLPPPGQRHGQRDHLGERSRNRQHLPLRCPLRDRPGGVVGGTAVAPARPDRGNGGAPGADAAASRPAGRGQRDQSPGGEPNARARGTHGDRCHGRRAGAGTAVRGRFRHRPDGPPHAGDERPGGDGGDPPPGAALGPDSGPRHYRQRAGAGDPGLSRCRDGRRALETGRRADPDRHDRTPGRTRLGRGCSRRRGAGRRRRGAGGARPRHDAGDLWRDRRRRDRDVDAVPRLGARRSGDLPPGVGGGRRRRRHGSGPHPHRRGAERRRGRAG